MSEKRSSRKKITPLSVILRILSILIPLPTFLLCTLLFFPGAENGFLFVGSVGCVLLSLGLFWSCGLMDRVPFPRNPTAVVLLFGAVLIGASLGVLYTPETAEQILPQELPHYLALWGFCLFPPLWYPLLRLAFRQYLRGKGYSRSRLKYKLKGAKNFWFYETVRTGFDMNGIYWLNRLGLLLYCGAVAVQFLLGWWKPLGGVVSFLLCLTLLMWIIMWVVIATEPAPKSDGRSGPSPLFSVVGILLAIVVCIGLVALAISFADIQVLGMQLNP